jgi:hypothetical protein
MYLEAEEMGGALARAGPVGVPVQQLVDLAVNQPVPEQKAMKRAQINQCCQLLAHFSGQFGGKIWPPIYIYINNVYVSRKV